MTAPDERLDDRRQWMTGSLRYAAAAGISVLSAGLLMRRGADAGTGCCPMPVDCGNCSVRQSCKRAQRKQTGITDHGG